MLKNKLRVHLSDGTLLASIILPKNVIGISFLEDERILIVKKDGKYNIYNPYDKNYE